jgi:hypothetical protein
MDNKTIETYREFVNYNRKLMPAVEKTVEHFRAQREDKALSLLIPVIEGLQWIVEVVLKTKDTLRDYGVNVLECNVNNTLKELTGALENQDYVLLGDLLEYEVLGLLDEWQKGIESAIERAE